jgi:hypothetical protein
MKQLVLFLLLSFTANIIFSQDTIRSLVITEVRLSGSITGYIELTNMGDSAVQLSQFEIGALSPWQSQLPFIAEPGNFSRIPERLLDPGESFVICCEYDYNPKQFALGFIEDFQERLSKPDLLEIADWKIHMPEGGGSQDSVSFNHWKWLNFDGRICYYIEQHLPSGDSVVIDQVNGVFDGENGQNNTSWGYSVAGYYLASGNSTIIRKFNIKTGNIDFANARGIGEEDSEWIVVPNQGFVYRKNFWTAGNHLNAKLNENTFQSEVVDVDYKNKTITVPWGIRRADDVINYFKTQPGIAWNYHSNHYPEDSLSHAAKTGDLLEVFACGEKVEKAVFTIIVTEPPKGANQVIPVCNRDPYGNWKNQPENAFISWPRVTRNSTGMDSIWGYGGGIPFATPTDSLLERLEKAPLSKWEFEWVDGIKRPELKNGDILKVTAENGNIKKYFIAVLGYLPKHNALLSSITFPDISSEESLLYGWRGDTIPYFNSTTFQYTIKVPYYIDKIPALVARPEEINATVYVDPATSLTGTKEDRTIIFTVTAEDDKTTTIYTIELIKEKSPQNIQPWFAEPFLSEFVFWDQWSNNFAEICNPGTLPLDLSNYMFAMAWNTNPAEVIKSRMEANDWLDRYDKYIPGYKWVNEEKWKITPGILERDLNVNSIVQPGDVFCLGAIYMDFIARSAKNYNSGFQWNVLNELDVQFNNFNGSYQTYTNPWNEQVSVNGNPVRKWNNSNWYMFKILNDSIKMGLKPANDPNDFELIETFGMAETGTWKIAGYVNSWRNWMLNNFIRKPHITKGNPVWEGSFGTNEENCEWMIYNDFYWNSQGLEYPFSYLAATNNIGQHFYYPLTHFISTISSEKFRVSEGYSDHEKIWGVTTGTTVSYFMANIIKNDSAQTLKVLNSNTGIQYMGKDLLANNDTLIVLSADSTNTTKYILEVNDEGLSSNALLSSDKYLITMLTSSKNGDEQTLNGLGTIAGFEYGTTLKTILSNINVPQGAALFVINQNGELVPTKILNFDNKYTNITVNSDMYIKVIAENRIATMNYQLSPDGTEYDAFLLSDVYSISQKQQLIKFVPRGTNVSSLKRNLYPSNGATFKVVNKLGQERTDGIINEDDKVVVTSMNRKVTKVYYLSLRAEKYIPQTTYLAYILSEVYSIDQLNHTISGTLPNTVADFMAQITPAPGANVILVESNGIEKTSGQIQNGDLVKVSSIDGKHTVYYTFDSTTSAGKKVYHPISVFPNPTEGKLFITGLDKKYKIEIFNVTGILVQSLDSSEYIETISMEYHPTGIYMVVLRSPEETKVFKIVKK